MNSVSTHTEEESLRAGEWTENDLVTHRRFMVSGASVVGVWILIPLALLGIAYVITALTSVAALWSGLNGYVLLGVTLGLQVTYWCLVAGRAGRSWAMGLWALIPVVCLIPTFTIARAAVGTRLDGS